MRNYHHEKFSKKNEEEEGHIFPYHNFFLCFPSNLCPFSTYFIEELNNIMASLTRGALHKILSGGNEPNFHPIVLVKNARNIPSNAAGGPARWKIVVTDGQDVATAMLATQLAALAECGELSDNCLLQLMDYMTNEVGNTK